MSRGRDDDDRIDHTDRAPDRRDERPLSARAEDIAQEGLNLPRGEARERVEFRGREYRLNASETRALATVGAFRVIAPADVGDDRHGKDVWHGDWRSLAEQGLLTRESLADRDGVRHVVALTREGKDLLEAHATLRSDGRQQAYYADIVKPRELRHDAQIYPLYREEAARIEHEGGRITRVILDYELKGDYQRYLNREPGEEAVDLVRDRVEFARAHGLPIVDGHLELPDLRIEYEDERGQIAYRDVELVTEHYSRGQLAGKARAGFARYRSCGGGSARQGGTPFDPHHLERL